MSAQKRAKGRAPARAARRPKTRKGSPKTRRGLAHTRARHRPPEGASPLPGGARRGCTEPLSEGGPTRRELAMVTREVVSSTAETGILGRPRLAGMPSRDRVVEIVTDLENLIFPGFFRRHGLPPPLVPYHVGNEVGVVFEKISAEVARSLRHACPVDTRKCDRCLEAGESHALSLLRKIPRLRRRLEEDVRAAYRGDPAAKSYEEIIYSYPGMKAITVHRLAHELHLQGVPLLPRIMTEYAHSVTGVDIHPGARIGRRFFIDHGTGVVIGETTEIGDDVRIYQGVTLGALTVPRGKATDPLRYAKRHPTIESNVTIYAGTTILGGDTVIGKDSIVGGNLWLTTSVPAGTTIINRPPKPVFQEIPNSKGGSKKKTAARTAK